MFSAQDINNVPLHSDCIRGKDVILVIGLGPYNHVLELTRRKG